MIVRYELVDPYLSEMVILKPTSQNPDVYVGQTFNKLIKPVDDPTSKRNSDVWRLSTVDLYDYTNGVFCKRSEESLVIAGEWECAIREKGASDFMGGNAHGDENFTHFTALLDGRPLYLKEDFIAEGKQLDMICVSFLNRVDHPDQILVKHVKKYTITEEQIMFEQSFHFLEEICAQDIYIGMFPVNRTYTSFAWRTGQVGIEEIYEDDHATTHTYGNDQKVFMWGDRFAANVEFESDSPYRCSLFIQKGTKPRYNKVYYAACPQFTQIPKDFQLHTKCVIDYHVDGSGL